MHEALAGPWIGHADTCRNPRSCQRGGSGPDRLDRWGAGPFPLQPRGSRTRLAPMPQSNRRERGSASAKNGRSPWIWLKIRPFQPSSPGSLPPQMAPVFKLGAGLTRSTPLTETPFSTSSKSSPTSRRMWIAGGGPRMKNRPSSSEPDLDSSGRTHSKAVPIAPRGARLTGLDFLYQGI